MFNDLKVITQVDTVSNIVIVKICGEIRIQHLRQIIEKVVATDGFYRSMNALVDLREAKFRLSSMDFDKISSILLSTQIQRGHGYKLALLVDNDLQFGLSRMIAVELEQVPILARVMKTYDDALQWVTPKSTRDISFESA